MQSHRQSHARCSAGVAALRLACAVLVALWALSAVPAPMADAPSLAQSAREHAVLAAKRPATAIAELATSRPGKSKVWSPRCAGLVGEVLSSCVFVQGTATHAAGPEVAGEPRSANLARAPPLPLAA
jgi:hypothetical protein